MRCTIWPFLCRALFGAPLTMLLALAACRHSSADMPSPCNDAVPATYAAVVSPIFEANCRRCHGSSVYQTLGGGQDLSSYQGIKNQPTGLIVGCIEHQPGYDAMPKGGPKILACDINRIRAWMDAGALNN